MANKKKYYLLIALCFMAYTVAYIGRLNYAASMVQIIEEFGSRKEVAGLVSSFFFVAYGVGQLVNGLLCKRYNVRVMITASLVLSAVLNFTMTFMPSLSAMKYLWLFNGVAQSVLWSSLIRILSEYLPQNLMSKAIVIMSSTVAVGTFAAYGLASLFVYVGNWKITFWVAAGILLVAAIAWFIGISKVENGLEKYVAPLADGVAKKDGSAKKAVLICLAFVAVAGIADGFVKDGMTSWVPNLMSENFGLKNYFSIILTLALPLVSLLGAVVAEVLRKKLTNPMSVIAVMFAASAVMLVVVYFSLGFSLALTVAAFGVVSLAMAGANTVITSVVPLTLRNSVGNNSGKIAGLVNAFCYLGSALASTLLGYVAEDSGWTAVVITLFAVSACIIAVCLVGYVPWKKREVKQ